MSASTASTATPGAPSPVAHLAATITAAASLLTGRVLVRAGLRRAPEGWRRTVGVLLRSESTRFSLSAFGLHVPVSVSTSAGPGTTTEDRIARGLLTFLGREPDAHFSLDCRPWITRRQPTAYVDVVVQRFAADGRLDAVHPWLAVDGPATPSADAQRRIHHEIVNAYNRCSGFEEVERPRRLMAELRSKLAPDDLAHARRILAATCLSFDARDLANPSTRFSPPSFSARRSLGFGYLSWIARVGAAGDMVDLWVSAHHVGLDGVPLQELLTRLEGAWGSAEPVVFPAAGPGTAFSGPQLCNAPGERAVEQLTMFTDLSPVLALRHAVSTRFGPAAGGDVTLGTLLAWLLSQEPEFAGVRIASTVDVAASNGYERDVDVVSLRPADFVTGPGAWDGFPAFAREFNRTIAACRARTSAVRGTMQTAGLMPEWAHATLVRAAPASLDDTFGTLCVTIIRDAKVFLAPMTDLGLGLGFFAIGSAALPTSSGHRVASVSVKGEAGRIAHYPAIFHRMIDRAGTLPV